MVYLKFKRVLKKKNLILKTQTGIDATTDDVTMRNLLQTLPGVGSLNVTRSKDCAGYKWRVEWLNGGNKLPISVIDVF